MRNELYIPTWVPQRLLIMTCILHMGLGDWSWIYYDCESPDGVSPTVTCKYTDWNSNYIDVTTADILCCHETNWYSNLTTVECPTSSVCWGWDSTSVKVYLDPNTVATTYGPSQSDSGFTGKLSLSTKLKIAGAACSVFVLICGVCVYCCKKASENTNTAVIYDQQEPIPLTTTQQPTADVTVDMTGGAHQVPSYTEAMGPPKPDQPLLGYPLNNTVPSPTPPIAPSAPGGDLPPPPSYEEVTSSADTQQVC